MEQKVEDDWRDPGEEGTKHGRNPEDCLEIERPHHKLDTY